MFPRGGAELVQHFYVNCNQELSRILKEQTENADKSRYNEIILNLIVHNFLSVN